jgi:hypothetical protein
MLDNEVKINQFLIGYCGMLVADIADERMAEQPSPGVNHPAWILGHLAYSADYGVTLLGGEKTLPAEWTTLFGPGSKVSSSRSDYAPKEELARAVEQGFKRLLEYLAGATPDHWAKPTANPRMRVGLPTVKEGIAFLLTGHLGVHLGQLSMWRRLIGLAPMF